MTNKNYTIYSDDKTRLNTLADEYRMLGRFVKVYPGKLVVFALRPGKPKKRDDDGPSDRIRVETAY
jgi:hypothetical protein